MHFKDSQQLLEQLLRLDTSQNNQHDQRAALDLIDASLNRNHAYHRVDQLVEGVSSSYWYPAGHQAVDVLMSAHVDVVPADVAQFRPRIKGDRLYARGAFDMKGPMVASIDALRRFGEESRTLAVGLLVTADEEVGGFNGTKAFLQRHPELRPPVVIVPDGGSGHGVVIEQKGYIDLELVFSGRSAHSARPWEGDNAILRATAAIQKITDKFPNGSDDDWRTTAVITELTANGSAMNAVPDMARARLNIRNVRSDESTAIIAFCKSLDPKAQCKVLINEPALEVDAKAPALDVLCQVFERVHGRRPAIERYPSTSDARHFVGRAGTIVITRPEGGGAHSHEEWISIKGLADFSQVMYLYLGELAKKAH